METTAKPSRSLINKNDRKTVNGWAMYDWANSVYSLVITSSIFPIFYQNATPEFIHILGYKLHSTTLYSYALSASFLIVAIISPLLSGIADYSGRKKLFMQIFCYMGSAACCGLYFYNASFIIPGLMLVMLAAIGYSGSLVFYNAFLPEIATPDQQDRVSAKGYALGYIGSVILLVVNLLMITYPAWFGLKPGPMAARLSFLSVGIWWAAFAQITFRRLPENVFRRKDKGHYLYNGYRELIGVFKLLAKTSRLKRFLIAFFVFNMGVQTVMYMAVLYAKEEIDNMPDSGLIISILIIQLIAVVGAYFFSWLSGKVGNLRALVVSIVIWIFVCLGAYVIHTPNQFYGLAALVGGVMGGIQSLSRSTYSKFLPDTIDHASFFSFYDVCDKIGIVVGTFTFGYIYELTGSLRNSALALGSFFIVGIILMAFVPKNETITAPLVES